MEGYNYTTHVRQVLQNARLESAKLQHEYVGPEHVLLALVGVTDGVAAAVLESLSIDRNGIRQKVAQTVKRGSARDSDVSKLPYKRRVKRSFVKSRTADGNRIRPRPRTAPFDRAPPGLRAPIWDVWSKPWCSG